MNNVWFNPGFTATRSRERRYRVLFVAPEMLVSALFGSRKEFSERIVFEGIPDDCEIEGMGYFPERAAFGFRLWHPSFSEAAPFEVIPEVRPTIKVERNPDVEKRLAEFRASMTRLHQQGLMTLREANEKLAAGEAAKAPETPPPARRGYEFL